MARLDLDDLPPRIANLLLSLEEGGELLLIQHGGLLRRFVVQSAPSGQAAPAPKPTPKQMRSPVPAATPEAPAVEAEPAPEPEPAPPISSPVTEQKTREIFESFRAAIEDEL